jgi:hypothetical protein
VTALPGDGATVAVFVAVAPEDAFDVFTREIDLWWRTGPKYRIAGKRRGRLYFEPGTEGRLFETFETASGSRTFEIGKVTVWEPPARLALVWRNVNFTPDEATQVDVSFDARGDGTLVTVRHSGYAALRPGHPARHGREAAAFSRMIGLWWGDLMTALRMHVIESRPRPE